MSGLGNRGLALQALAAASLLFGGPALVASGVIFFNGGRQYELAAAVAFALNLALVALTLSVQLYVTHWGVITVLLPCALVAVAPHGEGSGKLGVCYVLLLGFVYLWRRWDRLPARVAGALQVLLVLFAAHPPLITHGPSDYHQLMERGIQLFGPLAPWLQAQVLDGRPGQAAHFGWLGSVMLAIASPALLQLDVLIDVLRRWRDRIRAEEEGEAS